MIFYDFEVTKYDWLVVLIDPEQIDKPYKVLNDPDLMEQIYEQYKDSTWKIIPVLS